MNLLPSIPLFRLFLFCALALSVSERGVAQSDNLPAAREPAGPVTNGPAPASAAAGPRITFNSVHVDGPYVAMTFDDGPNATLTPKLLDLLAAHHMKVTFFVVGENAAEYPEILQRAAREGHEIANHSWSHPNLGKMGDDAVRRELQKTDDAIRAAIGVRPTLMRPPYGSITPRQKDWINDSFGYKIIIWDVDPLDWKRPGPSVVTRRILEETRPGSIILAHDIHPSTLEAMPATFDQLQARGLKFVTVSELIAMARPLPPKAAAGAPARRTRPPGAPQDAPSPVAPAQPSPAIPNG